MREVSPVLTHYQDAIGLHQIWLKSLGKSGARLSLGDADLSGLDLHRVNFSQAILPGTKLDREHLSKCDFYSANLASASFANADLSDSILTKANLDYSQFPGANLTRAKLFRATLVQTNLVGANLSGVDLRHTFLSEAELDGVNLQGAHLQDAYFDRVHLAEANFEGAVRLSSVSLTEIYVQIDGFPRTLCSKEAHDWLQEMSRVT